MRLPKLKNQYNQIRTGYLVIIDIGCIAVALNVFALFHHVLPRKLSAQGDKESYIAEQQSAGTSMENFTDKFTDGEVIQDDTTYKSGDISIAVNEVSKDNMRYYVADIYVKDITKIKTAFAKGTYGKAITDTVLNMAEENGAVLAANGDYYGTGETGVVIRNGVLYRGDADEDVCVLFKDGTMKIYHKDSFDSDTVMAQGAWPVSYTHLVYLKDGSTSKEVVEELKTKYGDENMAFDDFNAMYNSILDSINSGIALLSVVCLSVTLLVIILILFMLIKMKLLKEKRMYGIYKALGYTSWQLMWQTTMNFAPVISVGALLGIIMGRILVNPILVVILSMSGIKKCYLEISPMIFMGSFLFITVMAFIISMVLSRRVKKIEAYRMIVE